MVRKRLVDRHRERREEVKKGRKRSSYLRRSSHRRRSPVGGGEWQKIGDGVGGFGGAERVVFG